MKIHSLRDKLLEFQSGDLMERQKRLHDIVNGTLPVDKKALMEDTDWLQSNGDYIRNLVNSVSNYIGEYNKAKEIFDNATVAELRESEKLEELKMILQDSEKYSMIDMDIALLGISATNLKNTYIVMMEKYDELIE
jgi:hypothetical protein